MFWQDGFAEDEFTQTGKDFMSPREMYDIEEDELEICKPVFLSLHCSLLQLSLWSYLKCDAQTFFLFSTEEAIETQRPQKAQS